MPVQAHLQRRRWPRPYLSTSRTIPLNNSSQRRQRFAHRATLSLASPRTRSGPPRDRRTPGSPSSFESQAEERPEAAGSRPVAIAILCMPYHRWAARSNTLASSNDLVHNLVARTTTSTSPMSSPSTANRRSPLSIRSSARPGAIQPRSSLRPAPSRIETQRHLRKIYDGTVGRNPDIRRQQPTPLRRQERTPLRQRRTLSGDRQYSSSHDGHVV